MSLFFLPKFSLNKIELISHVDLPPKLIYPVRQGLGKDSQIVVSRGEKIKRGQMIARGDLGKSQFIHSAVGGTVNSIKNTSFAHMKIDIRSVEVDFGGEYFSLFSRVDENIDLIEKTKILERLRKSGIYDLDIGDAYSYIENKQRSKEISYVIVNAVEFSPYMLLEEKILQLHAREIATAVSFLTRLFSDDVMVPQVLVNSNFLENRIKFRKEFKTHRKKSCISNRMNFMSISEDSSHIELQDNLVALCHSLSKRISKEVRLSDKGALEPQEVHDKVLVLRPSTLLAIYEAVVLLKPQTDMYIQIMTGVNKVCVQRVLLGTPFTFLKSSFNVNWTELPQHIFSGNFFRREILVDLSIPVMKNHLHYWLLEDKDFTVLYRQLQKWMISNVKN